MKVKNGDLLKILMCDNSHQYAEKVGTLTDTDEYEVYFITPDDNNIFTYNTYIDIIPRKSVLYHVRNNSNYEEAWKCMKFRTINNDCSRLYKDDTIESDNESVDVEEIDCDTESDLGSEDTYSSEDSVNESEDNDFINDGEVESYCQSNCQCEICESIKQNNILYNSWVPKNMFEKRMKFTIDKIELKEIQDIDNINFMNS